MEVVNLNSNEVVSVQSGETTRRKASTQKPFILSNTEEVTLQEIQQKHIIPVYVKDNEPLISHYDFIDAACEVTTQVYGEGNLCQPSIRVSHAIKGRIPEARNKPAGQLMDREKTLYYERMMFVIEIPSNYDEIDGQTLTLTVGGVKAYNLDKFYNKKGALEHFKVFAGFKNSVCCNLCVFTDGLLADIAVTGINELKDKIYDLLCNYNAIDHLHFLQDLPKYSLTENQFAQFIGRCRMYQHLSVEQRMGIPALQLGDAQINQICRDYYKDNSFCKDINGNINLWKLYNLFTGAIKSSYIDTFLERNINANDLTKSIMSSLVTKSFNWFLQ